MFNKGLKLAADMKIHRFVTRSFLLTLVGMFGIGTPVSANAEKSIEERTSQAVNDLLVQQGAPVLQVLIARLRDEAVRAGILPIPLGNLN